MGWTFVGVLRAEHLGEHLGDPKSINVDKLRRMLKAVAECRWREHSFMFNCLGGLLPEPANSQQLLAELGAKCRSRLSKLQLGPCYECRALEPESF